jgi:putative acetyltransferase
VTESALDVHLERPEERAAALAVERTAFGDGAEEVGIVRAVRDEEGSFALVAVEDAEVVGHVQFSRGWIGGTAVLALGPVGVRPDRQRRGIGSALIREGLDEAAARGEAAVMLLGSPAFYPRFGFEAGRRRGLRNPFAGAQPDGFVVREDDFMLVVLDETKPLAGAVRWHPAFGEAG